MKNLIVSIILIGSVSVFAELGDVFQTTDVTGTNVNGKPLPTECFFEAVKMYQNENLISIFIFSDAAASIHFRIEIPSGEIPLKEGDINSGSSDVTLSYKNGVLKYQQVDSNNDADTETISIEIDKDLKKPTKVIAEDKLADKKDGNSKIFQSLNCNFN